VEDAAAEVTDLARAVNPEAGIPGMDRDQTGNRNLQAAGGRISHEIATSNPGPTGRIKQVSRKNSAKAAQVAGENHAQGATNLQIIHRNRNKNL
jgi:hypothetical protein